MHATIDTPGMPAHPCALVADFRLLLPFRAIVRTMELMQPFIWRPESSEVWYSGVSLLVGV